jgi:prolyl oligopeptidase
MDQRFCIIPLIGALLAIFGKAAEPQKPAYPPSKIDEVVDTLHGVKVPDPYRWLENGDDPAVKEWTAKQNAFTRAWLDKLPGRDKLRARLDQLLDVGSISVVVPRKGHYFYTLREAKQNQPILYVENDKKERKVVVDPNPLSKDGTITLDWWFPSSDGKLVAYGLSTSGSEQSTLHVRDVERDKDLDDKIEQARACSVAWNPDGKGFYYTRYPKPGSVPKGDEKYYRHVFFHQLGTDPAKDAKIFGEGRDAQDWPEVSLSPDGRWLVINVEQGWAKTEVYFKDLLKNENFVTLVEKVDAIFKVIPRDDRFFILTNEKAPRYKVMTVEPQEPQRENWKEEFPESKTEVLQAALPIGNYLVGKYLSGTTASIAYSEIKPSKRGENWYARIKFGSGAIAAIAGEADGHEVFYSISSYTSPPDVACHDLRRDAKPDSRLTWSVNSEENFGAKFDVEQVKYPSKDGALIPMTLISKKGLKKDGKTPTVLYGYGGFNINLTPTFNPTRFLTIVEHGGIMAIANLRGGGEFGEEWHAAGMLGKKQNVFDDFIAAAEYLIKEKYTDRDHLAIMGRSNGGLLVGAALTQRPDLFRAVVCGVPLLDMVRYHRFLIAKLWIPEYGAAENADDFKWLHAYSPYHHVKDGTAYPAVLLTTAESDSRVDPLHARKMTARLQAATSSDRPILLRLEEKAGHGQGKPRAKVLDEETDTWSFLLHELGVKE